MAKSIKEKSRLSALLVIGLITIITIFSGCIQPPGDDQTLQTLQNAIDMLDRQPGQWENTMKNTIDELGRIGTASSKEVLADVQSTYNSALGQTESTAFCGSDFIGHRLQQRLQAILHKYDETAPEPTIVPIICSTNPPDHIDAGPNPPQTQLVVYYGYDFLEFSDHNFTSELKYGSGQIVKQNFGFVNIPHNYELTLNIQGEVQTLASLDRNQGPAVVLKWGDQNVGTESGQSELPVLIPTPGPEPLIGVQVNAHIEGIGWMNWATNPDNNTNYAGTIDQSRRMEAVQIRLVNAPAGMKVCYMAHVQDEGWMDEVCDGRIAGTTGQGRRMEAIQIRLVDAPANIHINYRAFVQNFRWLPWQSDGNIAGTTGQGLRMEAMNVKISGQ
jgi:hypothetical protein